MGRGAELAAAADDRRRFGRRHNDSALGLGSGVSGAAVGGFGPSRIVGNGGTDLPPPSNHAYAAVAWVLLAYGILHALVALLCAAFVRARIGGGYISARRFREFEITRLFGDYSGMVILIILLCLFMPSIAL